MALLNELINELNLRSKVVAIAANGRVYEQ